MRLRRQRNIYFIEIFINLALDYILLHIISYFYLHINSVS